LSNFNDNPAEELLDNENNSSKEEFIQNANKLGINLPGMNKHLNFELISSLNEDFFISNLAKLFLYKNLFLVKN
jgi:hypothetical protein